MNPITEMTTIQETSADGSRELEDLKDALAEAENVLVEFATQTFGDAER